MKIAVIGGMGRMGLRHCNTLKDLGYDYDVFDAQLNNQYSIDYCHYTHIIVATPTDTHANIFRTIVSHNQSCRILVEKPVVNNVDDLDLLNHKQLFAGMIRRFDPLTHRFRKLLEEKSVHQVLWFKSGKRPNKTDNANLDLGIHIVDTWIDFNVSFKKLNYCVEYGDNIHDVAIIFYEDNTVKMFNFNERNKTEYFLPLQNELISFLNNEECNAYESHLHYFSLVGIR